ncbi:hypothetical protein L484_007367 [Morus notabilis]|uniref:Uncharacterized protein n=1 Tax=Morus notabilis TaxID=981085 RepID=W9R095_9ROSA|nr:hypothetical protein L484_007367 [Morus notabilis]
MGIISISRFGDLQNQENSRSPFMSSSNVVLSEAKTKGVTMDRNRDERDSRTTGREREREERETKGGRERERETSEEILSEIVIAKGDLIVCV